MCAPLCVQPHAGWLPLLPPAAVARLAPAPVGRAGGVLLPLPRLLLPPPPSLRLPALVGRAVAVAAGAGTRQGGMAGMRMKTLRCVCVCVCVVGGGGLMTWRAWMGVDGGGALNSTHVAATVLATHLAGLTFGGLTFGMSPALVTHLACHLYWSHISHLACQLLCGWVRGWMAGLVSSAPLYTASLQLIYTAGHQLIYTAGHQLIYTAIHQLIPFPCSPPPPRPPPAPSPRPY